MDLIKEAKTRGYKDGTVISYFKGDYEKLGCGEFEVDEHNRLIKYENSKAVRDRHADKRLYDVIYDQEGWVKIVSA